MTKRELDKRIRKRRRGAIRLMTLAAALLITVVCLRWCGTGAEAVDSETIEANAAALYVVPSLNDDIDPDEPEYTPVPSPEPDTYELTDSERDIVERVVMSECEGETQAGMIAVAQCIRNTAEATGMRPDAVVLEEGQYASPADSVTQDVKDAVALVFDWGGGVTDEPIRWFYAPARVVSVWHETALEYVCTIGGHRFFKEVGA